MVKALKCWFVLNESIHYELAYESIKYFIVNAFRYAGEEQKKRLCYNLFYPQEENKIYKRGKTYNITIRSVESLKNIFEHVKGKNGLNIKLTGYEETEIKQTHINMLYNITPTVVTMQNQRFWTKEDDRDFLLDALHLNLERKYNEINNTNVRGENFIKGLTVTNRKLIKIIQANMSATFAYYGNKFEIYVNNDQYSQDLAYLALGLGLGEKNAQGCGFMGYR
ncbi:MAG: hypothetical protein LBL65_04615 [Campylobacteraceae bacterium]|jgi:CRISPR-associated endoribonuclease Cas6|nr:hypothetical protein [Campylobacteraceae bacterium]